MLDEVIIGGRDDVDDRVADCHDIVCGEVHARLASRRADARSTAAACLDAESRYAFGPMTSEVQAAAREPQLRSAIPLSLFALSIFYGGMVCIAGVLGNKQVDLGPLAVEAGIFAFLLLVVTSSSVAELHGRSIANRLVLLGFVPLIVSLVLSLIVLALPASPQMDPARLSAFETVMGGTPRIWIGGILAYGVSTFLNVTIFSRLKAREGASLLWLRAGIASVLSQIVDTLIFITVAFYGVFPIGELMLGQMLAKVVLSAVLVPPLVYAFVALGRGLDQRE
jgi:uncharacterized integral membrane protein (TIGR00697 family)